MNRRGRFDFDWGRDDGSPYHNAQLGLTVLFPDQSGEMNELVIDFSTDAPVGAYRRIERDRRSSGDTDKQPITKQLPRRYDLEESSGQKRITVPGSCFSPPGVIKVRSGG